jgi:hypothetical protein
MIVRCKSDNNSVSKLRGLTIDKSYVVTNIDNIGFRIIDNEMRDFWYTKELFYPIDEERNKKIGEILDDASNVYFSK